MKSIARHFSTSSSSKNVQIIQAKQVANPAAENLRKLLNSGEILRTPCCHDALSARLIQRSGFKAAFMSGFGVACARGLPDAGLVSFEESKQVTTSILDAGKSYYYYILFIYERKARIVQ